MCTGAFRECFSKDIRLGMKNKPVEVSERCNLQRTQADRASTIRACLCTTDYCNDMPKDAILADKPLEIKPEDDKDDDEGKKL